jgi:hypothetical protein
MKPRNMIAFSDILVKNIPQVLLQLFILGCLPDRHIYTVDLIDPDAAHANIVQPNTTLEQFLLAYFIVNVPGHSHPTKRSLDSVHTPLSSLPIGQKLTIEIE